MGGTDGLRMRHLWHRMLTPLVAIAAALGMLVVVSSAGAAVAVRGASSCNANAVSPSIASTLSLALAKPTGLQAGDLMLATFSGYQSLSSAPSGWTATAAPTSSSGTWYRVATAAEPAAYTWTATKDILHNVSISGVITAFSGVDSALPIQQTTQSSGSSASVALPTATSIRAGSMRVSTVTSAAAVTSSFSGMTTACDRSAGSTAATLAYEPVGAGVVPTRTDARSGSGTYTAQTIVLNPDAPCSSGAFTLNAPSTISFPTLAATGADQQESVTTTMRVDDQRGLGPGWNVSATSTPFTNGSTSLPTDAVTITGATATAASGNCVPPLNAITYPLQLPTGVPAPTAAKLYDAAIATGTGPVDVALDMQLDVPANARIGTYTSAWTFTLQSGP
ncbi:MAG: WxL domain-containing protein [Patulibacter minatonensis]